MVPTTFPFLLSGLTLLSFALAVTRSVVLNWWSMVTFQVVHRTSTVLLINWNFNILFVRDCFHGKMLDKYSFISRKFCQIYFRLEC